jgi:hypothetical protein
VFVAFGEDFMELARAMFDLLRLHGIDVAFERRWALLEHDLLEPQLERSEHTVTVWIMLPEPSRARLVFADSELEHFLVRDLPLRSGLDDIARETLAEIVESSVLALLRGTETLSRAEVRARIAENLWRPPEPLASPKPLRQPPPNQRHQPQHRALRHRLEAFYDFAYSGPELGLVHGLGISAGIRFDEPFGELAFAGALEARSAQHAHLSAFDLAVQSNHAWLSCGLRRSLDRAWSFRVALAPGIEVARVHADSDGIGNRASPEPATLYFTPWLRAQLSIEWGDAPLAIELSALADVALSDVHYDITRNAQREQLAHPWLLQPGMLLGASWR